MVLAAGRVSLSGGRPVVLTLPQPHRPGWDSSTNPEDAEEYDHWDHGDFIINKATDKGLYIGLLPSWGEWVTPRFGASVLADTRQGHEYGHNTL